MNLIELVFAVITVFIINLLIVLAINNWRFKTDSFIKVVLDVTHHKGYEEYEGDECDDESK